MGDFGLASSVFLSLSQFHGAVEEAGEEGQEELMGIAMEVRGPGLCSWSWSQLVSPFGWHTPSPGEEEPSHSGPVLPAALKPPRWSESTQLSLPIYPPLCSQRRKCVCKAGCLASLLFGRVLPFGLLVRVLRDLLILHCHFQGSGALLGASTLLQNLVCFLGFCL